MKVPRLLLAPAALVYVALVLLDRHPGSWRWVLAGAIAVFVAAAAVLLR